MYGTERTFHYVASIGNILRRFAGLNDDFGSGYSSLSCLRSFPIDVLKTEQSLVRDITLEEDGAAVVRTIISLAHGLRLKVSATPRAA